MIAVAAAEALAGGPAALVTVLATEGSAPRGPGARMLVTDAASVGSIGGGALEWRAAEQARLMLAQPAGAWRLQDYPLGPLLGQCCGGRVRLLIERLSEAAWLAAVEQGGCVDAMLSDGPVFRRVLGAAQGNYSKMEARGAYPDRFTEPLDTPRRPLMLFGAGHVGRAMATLARDLPLSLAWFDSRPEADSPGVFVQEEEALVACAGAASENTAVLILTHDHGLDYRLTAAALTSPAGFVGLIGSATKRARFVSRLAADGVDIARLTCPIGASGITGKEPAVIAIAAMAQLLALRRDAA